MCEGLLSRPGEEPCASGQDDEQEQGRHLGERHADAAPIAAMPSFGACGDIRKKSVGQAAMG